MYDVLRTKHEDVTHVNVIGGHVDNHQASAAELFLQRREKKERRKERNREREMLLGLLCSFPVIDKWCENASCRRDVWRVDGVSLLSCPVLSCPVPVDNILL